MNSLNGIIILNKPENHGSYDVIRKLKKKFPQLPKTGFMGTLDPIATGVLPLFFGVATKIIPFISNDPKIYRLKISFGRSTDSFDVSGKTIESVEIPVGTVTEAKIMKIIPEFLGTIDQIPPPLSACKTEGKRAYQLFFEGNPVTLPARQRKIYEIEYKGLTNTDPPELELVVSCETGTYMRSLAVDLGKKLNLPAHLSLICRLSSGSFLISESVSLDSVLESSLEKYLLSFDRFLPFPEVIISDSSKLYEQIKNGNPLKNLWKVPKGYVKIKDSKKNILGIFESDGPFLKVSKILI